MRRHHHLVQAEQRRFLGGLDCEHVERGPGDVAGTDQVGYGRLVDETTTGAVHQPHAGPRLHQIVARQDVAGLLGQRRVQGDEVGPGQEHVEIDLLDAEVARPLRRQERVIGDHAHLQTLGAVGDDRADVAAADQAQDLAHELDAHEAVLLPFAGPGRPVGGGDLTGECEHQRDGMLGRGDRVAEGRVHHDHAALGRGLDIDVVDTDARPADDLEIGCGREHLGRDLGRGADREAIELRRSRPGARPASCRPGCRPQARARGRWPRRPGSAGRRSAPWAWQLREVVGGRLRRAVHGSRRTPSRARAAAPRHRRSRRSHRTRCAGRPARRGSSGCRRRPSARPGAWSCP